MAAKSNALDGQLLALLFNGATIAGLAQNATSAPVTALYLSLHTASPGPAGNQSTSEAAYPGYARQAVPRTTAGFAVTGESVALAANVTFPTATGGSETETYFAVGTSATGTGEILYFGPIVPTVAVYLNITPVMTTGTTITES